ncbi:hypothetical protein PIB30_045839 [Stylosanthes scabra]|uniref:Uncharacterized protein n=1 Tax=Stylosanthes scabra TaxID=79078 RepID=A0ABU6VEI1_9FABA|nr:hypothetical protein [Stylosanthes scabra]
MGLDKIKKASLNCNICSGEINTMIGNGLGRETAHEATTDVSDPTFLPRFEEWRDGSSESANEKTVRRVQVGRRRGAKKGKNKVNKAEKNKKLTDKKKKTSKKKGEDLVEGEGDRDTVETISNSGSDGEEDSNEKQACRTLKLGIRLRVTLTEDDKAKNNLKCMEGANQSSKGDTSRRRSRSRNRRRGKKIGDPNYSN